MPETAVHTGNESRWRRPILAGILLLTVALGSRGITDESSGLLGGDMARYLMDGVFVHDLVAHGGAWSMQSLGDFAERYYAKHPALSLGHHPPLPYFTLAGFDALFGVSVFSARLATLSWFVLAVWGVYALGRRLAGWQAASWAAVLFATNVYVVRFGQYVLSEMPMVALVLWSVNALLKYCETRRPRHFAWFVAAVVMSLFAKQLAAFMLPVYGVIIVNRLGPRSLLDRRLLLIAGAGILLVVPLIVMTFGLAPANVRVATDRLMGLTSPRPGSVGQIVTGIVMTHLSLPLVLVSAAGAIAFLVRRHQLALIGLSWIVSVIGGTVLFVGSTEPARYAFGAMPAYFLLAAGLAGGARSQQARGAAAVVLTGAVLWQGWLIRDVRPTGASGYETGAAYVVAHTESPVILYDSTVDTGYFVFFVRKHDPQGRLITLRADKVLVSESERAERDAGPDRHRDTEAFYAALKMYGVQLIAVEERRTGPSVLRTMQDELRSSRFLERQRIPLVSRAGEVDGVNLVIYQFLEAQPPNLDAQVFIGLPLGNREIKLRLRDLIETGGR